MVSVELGGRWKGGATYGEVEVVIGFKHITRRSGSFEISEDEHRWCSLGWRMSGGKRQARPASDGMCGCYGEKGAN